MSDRASAIRMGTWLGPTCGTWYSMYTEFQDSQPPNDQVVRWGSDSSRSTMALYQLMRCDTLIALLRITYHVVCKKHQGRKVGVLEYARQTIAKKRGWQSNSTVTRQLKDKDRVSTLTQSRKISKPTRNRTNEGIRMHPKTLQVIKLRQILKTPRQLIIVQVNHFQCPGPNNFRRYIA